MKLNYVVNIVSDFLKIEHFLLQHPTLKIKIIDGGIEYDDGCAMNYGDISLQVGENTYVTSLYDDEDSQDIINFLTQNNIPANHETIEMIFSVVDYYMGIEECFEESEINLSEIIMSLSTIKTLINIYK
jgi:hypothetical protein